MIYEGALTEAFKEIILNELYESGDLYESIQIYSEVIGNYLMVDIQSEEYLIYHIERLSLIDSLVNLPEFEDMVNKTITAIIQSFLEYELNNIDGPDPTSDGLVPQVRILLNGSDI